MQIKEMFQGKLGLFFIVNSITSIGLNIGIVGVSWFIINTTKQNEVLGLYGAISLISSFIALLSTGSLIDKYNKVAIMKFCCFAQGLIFLLTGILYAAGVPVLYIIYGLAVLNMPCMTIFITASRGVIPMLLEESRLAHGNSIIETSIQIGAMFAAVLTGFLYKFFGFTWLIFIGAALTFTGYILLHFSKYSFDYALGGGAGFLRNMIDGLAYLKNRKDILFFGLIVFVPTIVISASNTVIPGYVEQYLGKGAVVYGVADMFFAVGAMISGFMISKLLVAGGKKLWQIGLFLLTTVSLILFIFNTSVLGFWILIFINGMAIAGLRVLLNTSLMEVVERQYLGRCLSILTAIAVVFQAGFSYLIGIVMDKYNAPVGFVVLGGIMIIGLVMFVFSRIKK